MDIRQENAVINKDIAFLYHLCTRGTIIFNILRINSCRMYPFRKRLGTDISALKKRRFFFAYFI
ncbi:hypothetical protein BACSTE_01301 [Bacteroides stercoris ATCC 43183]|uniref:Uncharacterized protein n=1 Tax=Bacteroides stercoris ATCC 43183 TaxID=449673 RepID=B0NP96_BACSE|nr:hypothetical protein BACSTE_01301 [Bacteroides stercoris ATCC 43183]